jgi:hypothetical protein
MAVDEIQLTDPRLRKMKQHEKFLLVLMPIAVSACAGIFTVDKKGDHEAWLRTRKLQLQTNPNMYMSTWQQTNKGSNFVRRVVLPNGNIENEYIGYSAKPCRTFYEYEPESGLIVGFRFEEKNQYDCRVTGA